MQSSIFPFEQQFAHDIYAARYKHPQDRNWSDTAARVVGAVMPSLYYTPGARAGSLGGQIEAAMERVYYLANNRLFCPGGRYLYAAGRDLHQVNNCILLRPEDTRESWAELGYKADMATMTGAGIGVWYGDVRPAGAPISRTGGVASGPMGLMRKINDGGRELLQGGNRRCAIWAGLPWWHSDIFTFIESKDWPEWLRTKKQEWADAHARGETDEDEPHAPMDKTNISVTLDDEFFEAYRTGGSPSVVEKLGAYAPDGGSWRQWAERVYDTALAHMLKHGEPGFTVDTGDKREEVLRNACTEITSADDSDVCNLGSLVLSRFDDPQQFGAAVRDAALFLTAGSLYSDVPYQKVAEVRDQNRRLGLGLIGVHEFCMQNHVKYGSPESFEVLEPYMEQYRRALEFAHEHQDGFGISLSKGASAIAPNGTIGILMESTSSSDAMFSKAEERVVTVANVHGPDRKERHVVVDPVAKRQAENGVPLEYIEDAYDLAHEPDRRIGMTAFLQQYVDHAISGTVNLPCPLDPVANVREFQSFSNTLMKHLPDLRGITVYPDGARAGQPRTPVDLEWALEQHAEVAADEGSCADGVCAL